MVCLRNLSVDTLHKGYTEDDDNDDNNNNSFTTVSFIVHITMMQNIWE
jgi:hypothetical protein